MKLNLAPKKSKSGSGLSFGAAWAIFALLTLLALGISAFAIFYSQGQLQAAKDRVEAARPNANQAVAQAQLAQQIVSSIEPVARNLELYQAAADHNGKFPRFYRQVLPYIPEFLRITRMQVSPVSETRAVLNLTGVVYSLQQHGDAQIALLRIPGAVAVTGDGYTPRPVLVNPLTEADQYGRAIRVGTDPLPLDGLDRLSAIIDRANSGTVGFENVGSFGADPEVFSPRGAMTTGAQVTYAVTLDATGLDPNTLPPGYDLNLLVPNPSATLRPGAGGAAASAPGGFGAPASAAPLSGEAAARAGGPAREER